MRTSLILIAVSMSSPCLAETAALPEPVAAMIRAAAQSGDAAKLETIASVARQTNPNSVEEIDALVKGFYDNREAERLSMLASQGYFQGWKGRVEAGASLARGNSRTTRVYGNLALKKEGLTTRHAIDGLADYQTDRGSVSRARYQAGYKFDYKFGERLYLSTLVQWDQDRLSGFARRFTQTLSLGYRVLNSSGILWDLEAGPGSQQIRFTDGSGDVQAIGRGTSAFSWKPLPRLEFSDNASVFAGPQNTTVTNTAALTVSVVGPLSTRLGWFWQRESNPPNNREQIDSTLRATVLYDF